MWHSWERSEKRRRFWWESPKERHHSKDRGVDGRMGSEWILERGWGWSGFNWLKIGTGGGYTEDGDEPSGSGATEVVTSFLRSAQKHT
jgi:hypothetical protein